MADVRLALGAEVDMASGKELSSGFDRMEGLFGSNRPKEIQPPIRRTIVRSGINPGFSYASFVLSLGQPYSGRTWSVNQFCITGADDRSTVTNFNAAVYIGESGNVSLAELLEPGLTAPSSVRYARKTIWVHDEEELFLMGYNGTAGAPITWVVRLDDWDTRDVEASHA